MAKIVIAGRSDCPYFARIELLGDRLAKNLKKFKLHKIMVQPDQWDAWLKDTCAEKGWVFSSSPIVWRELIDRGGKGVLIGGANEFQEYIKAYYDLESEMNSYDMRTIGAENKITKDELDSEERYYNSLSNPINICITNSISPTCYHLIHSITSGKVLGPKVEMNIRLLVTSEDEVEAVRGTAMEAEDLAHPCLRSVKVCISAEEAFENCEIIICLDEVLRQDCDSLQEWLIKNETLFSYYGSIINEKALKNCKVLVCGGGPINVNAMMIIKSATNLARQNIVAVATNVENHAKSIIGEKLSVNPAGVVNLLVWGNINGKRYLDVSQCRVHGYDGAIIGPYWYSVSAIEMLHENKWISSELPGLVASRNIKVSRIIGRVTSLSAANSISTLLRHWYRGSPHGEIFSLGVHSEGWYGVPEGIVFSFPVAMDPKGYWYVVQDIYLTLETKQGIKNGIEDIVFELGIIQGDIRASKADVLGETEAIDKEMTPLETDKTEVTATLGVSQVEGFFSNITLQPDTPEHDPLTDNPEFSTDTDMVNP